MKISVLIPTYNSERWIARTIESVLRQTRPADEILVLDDGSTDATISILGSYKGRITLLQQGNGGVAQARNVLCRQANGDFIAFLDHDDIWHPRYLEVQSRLFEAHPGTIAFFCGHVDFHGHDAYEWNGEPSEKSGTELIEPLNFLKRYNSCPADFASMSYCCIPRTIIEKMGEAPFSIKVSGADDFFLFNHFPLLGPVAYTPGRLVAYRIIKEAQSADRLKGCGLCIRSMEMLRAQYQQQANHSLARVFFEMFASKKRAYAKLLMGAGRLEEARRQLLDSMQFSAGAVSFVKSAALLGLIQLPVCLQPAWPTRSRPGQV